MLAELLRYTRLRCPPWAKSLGLAHEHVAITYRHRRNRAAWAPHLANSQSVILQAAERCRQHRRVAVIGAGDCLDVPVAQLADRFEEVILTDVVLGPEVRRLARRGCGHIRAEVWDATGALAPLADAGPEPTPAQVESLFRRSDPGLPPGGECDLIVSANCISQLGVVPLHRLGHADDDARSERCAAAAVQRHLHWLAARDGVRVLLGDVARLDLSPDHHVLRREPVPGMDALRAPDRTWQWWLAPIPELSRDHHRIHEVGAWIDG